MAVRGLADTGQSRWARLKPRDRHVDQQVTSRQVVFPGPVSAKPLRSPVRSPADAGRHTNRGAVSGWPY